MPLRKWIRKAETDSEEPRKNNMHLCPFSPLPHFEEGNFIGWSIERLAVPASEQFDADRLVRALKATQN